MVSCLLRGLGHESRTGVPAKCPAAAGLVGWRRDGRCTHAHTSVREGFASRTFSAAPKIGIDSEEGFFLRRAVFT